ncbi:MAG: hypothetical protein OXF30_01625 [Candidatus Saccharibacteria bacterium]|nr:hypothetical protein [Candidatus Saccharibacteria bacterium]
MMLPVRRLDVDLIKPEIELYGVLNGFRKSLDFKDKSSLKNLQFDAWRGIKQWSIRSNQYERLQSCFRANEEAVVNLSIILGKES